jgi:hypothetical protein
MRFKLGLITIVAVVLAACTPQPQTADSSLPSSASVDPACFRADEQEAAQAISFMTELMVLNDLCGVNVYDSFIKRNLTALSAYHRQLIGHFRNAGDRRAEDTVDKLVTHIANKVTLDNNGTSTASLCSMKTGYFSTASTLNHDNFRHFVTDLVATRKGEYPGCGDLRADTRQAN